MEPKELLEQVVPLFQCSQPRPLIFDVLPVEFSGSSTKFAELKGDVEALKALFRQPNSEIIVSGKDGITSDTHGFLAFLESGEAECDVDIVFVKHGRVLLCVSSSASEGALVLSAFRLMNVHWHIADSSASNSPGRPSELEIFSYYAYSSADQLRISGPGINNFSRTRRRRRGGALMHRCLGMKETSIR